MKKGNGRGRGRAWVLAWVAIVALVFGLVWLSFQYRGEGIPDPAADGPVQKREVISRTLDITRRYNAMEGPYDVYTIDMASLLGSSPHNSELWWFKGAKIDVLDENYKPYGQEFLCHASLEYNLEQRRTLFPTLDSNMFRLITFTQGCTEFVLPRGTGIPVSSEETWSVTFQTLNFNRDGHFKVHERMTFYFVRDKDLAHPLKALKAYTPYVTVSLGDEKGIPMSNPDCPCCLPVSQGKNAPNNMPNGVFPSRDRSRPLTGHWVVPTGEHEWSTPVMEIVNSFPQAQGSILHAAWSHVHPFCTELDLIEHKPGCHAEVLVKSDVVSKGGGELGLKKIGGFTSEEGIKLDPNAQLELRVKYNNTTGHEVDSMGIMGLFLEDTAWRKPDWVNVVSEAKEPRPVFVSAGQVLPTGGIPLRQQWEGSQGQWAGNAAWPSSAAVRQTVAATLGTLPLFDVKRDGPLEKGTVPIEIQTTSGVLEAEMRGDWAPENVTQMKRLIKGGSFDGVAFFRRVPNFICQTNLMNTEGTLKALVRRLPLEVKDGVKHERGTLSMAHWADPDTGVGSFSIMVASAPHLDGKFTVFGRLTDNPANQQVLDNLMLAPETPKILSMRIKSADRPQGKKTAIK